MPLSQEQKMFSSLCLLKTCEHVTCLEMHDVTEGYEFKIGSSFCTYYTDHLLSVPSN